MLLISLFDFYFPSIGLPVVPMLGTAIFAAVSMKWRTSDALRSRKRRRNAAGIALLLIVMYVCSAVWGLLLFKTGSVKGVVGMGLGTSLLTLIMSHGENEEYRKMLLQFCTRLLVIHVTFWAIQAFWYAATSNFLDFIQPITGVPTRHGTAAEGVLVRLDRFTGLYVEPGLYAQVIYWLITVRLIHSGLRLRLLDIVAMVTVAISLSISGMLLMAFLLTICGLKAIRNWRGALLSLAVVSALIVVGVTLKDTDAMTIIAARLNAPTADPSGRIRTTGGIETYGGLPDSAKIFGIGTGNSEAVDNFNFSFFMDLLASFGLIGAFVVAVMFVSLLRQWRVPQLLWLFIIGQLPGALTLTYPLWWLWIGMMALAGAEGGHWTILGSMGRLTELDGRKSGCEAGSGSPTQDHNVP